MSKFAGLALNVDTPSRLELRRPDTGGLVLDAEGKPAYIDLLSTDSSKAKAFEKALFTRRMRQGVKQPNADQIEQDMAERDAELTVGWYLVSLDGEPIDVPCNKANAIELYLAPGLAWIKEQAREHINERGNFTGK